MGSAVAVFIAEILASLVFIALCRPRIAVQYVTENIAVRWGWLWRHHQRMIISANSSSVLGSIATNLVPVAMIALVGVEAGGITYTVQRLAGVPVKFALVTVGEIWHKMVRRGDARAIAFARNPVQIAFGMVVIMGLMLLLINALSWFVQLVDTQVFDSEKLRTVVDAVVAYQLFFAATLCVNLFNRVLVMRSALHYKLIFDGIYLFVPIGLFLIGSYWVPEPNVLEGLFVLSVGQTTAYSVFAGLILWISARWRHETV